MFFTTSLNFFFFYEQGKRINTAKSRETRPIKLEARLKYAFLP